jgi:hypothetical protein
MDMLIISELYTGHEGISPNLLARTVGNGGGGGIARMLVSTSTNSPLNDALTAGRCTAASTKNRECARHQNNHAACVVAKLPGRQ